MDLLLIDANNIGYASMYMPALSLLSHNGQATGGILGVLQSTIRLINKFPDTVPILLWDGHAAWRKELCPEYKENRKDEAKLAVAESWERQRAIASALFLHLGILQVRAADAEADDLAGFLARAAHVEDSGIDHVILASADTDWWQAISEKVWWFSPIKDRKVTLEDLATDAVKDGPFQSPSEYLDAKVIAGDTSDNIPGVAGVGIKTACKLLRQYGGLSGICDAVARGEAKDKRSQAIAAAQTQIARNRQIMDWTLAPPICPSSLGIARDPFDWKSFSDLAREYGLQRLLDRFGTGAAWSAWESSVPWGEAIDVITDAVLPPSTLPKTREQILEELF